MKTQRHSAEDRREQRRRALLHLHLENTEQLRDKLQQEIHSIDDKLQDLKIASNNVNFGLMQTYVEMLHSRQSLFRQLDSGKPRLW
ncbi:hypothetical protein SIN8267_03035 [Sinobacterium norvegicum]|uniref:Uncharacterized protein n=1 Tax=Sinobacterium norvegicum TaxID=1641715 RepID=A0ABN8EKM3_9GAMM|nr:hypothetical protein [Sinobacterium norvegicum]CAH0992897.1 hypothetical protein SIN8267_03035 [Sinobacterium norvegicum]